MNIENKRYDGFDVAANVATFKRIARETLENGGGTYYPATGVPAKHDSGYYVGIYALATIGIGDNTVTPASIAALARLIAESWQHDTTEQYIGTWYDGGIVHVDAVRWYPEAATLEALAAARRASQRYIYDIGRGVSWPVVGSFDSEQTTRTNAPTKETQELIESLHESLVVAGDEYVADWHRWSLERLRVLTDNEYAECAYGDEQECGNYTND